MQEDAPGEKKEEAKPKEEPPADLKDIVTTDFMKDLVTDLNLDIDQNEMGDLMKEAGLGDNKEEKKEEEDPKKDDDKDKEKKKDEDKD